MSRTVNHERAEYKYLNGSVHGTSRTDRAVRSGSLNLNEGDVDGVRASYSIEGDTTIGAVLVAFFCAGMAMGGALVLGAVRSLGWR